MYRADGPDGPVAIKVLAPAAELDPAARTRFAHEAAALAALRHPALVTLLDHGVDDELGPYLVLPLLAGPTLRALAAGAALPPEAAALLAAPIAGAVAALHAAGYVHRDLKPDNVIASPDGRVTVIDLGLAWRDGMTRLTETGTTVGSIGYMAPEQLEGRAVDAAADVWAIGVMLYEWTAGRRPFARARGGEEAAATLIGTYPALTSIDRRVDAELGALVARCLAPAPEARPTAAALATALATWLAAHDLDGADDDERAALIAAPAAYQARVAPRQVRAAAAAAGAALAGGEPFAALAACDRGLAYAPDDAALAALVQAAERATAVATAPAPTAAPIAATAPTTVATPRRRRGPLLVAIAAALIALVVIAMLADGRPATTSDWRAEPARASEPSGWTTTTTTSRTEPATPEERALARDFVGLFGKVLDASAAQRAGEADPTSARGWFERSRREPPADAVASLRQAVALAPDWPEAYRDLCVRLLQTGADAGAACARALELAPRDHEVRGLRAITLLQAKDYQAAIADLTQVIAADDTAAWRIGRGKAYARLGQRKAAVADFARACKLGDADGCTLAAEAPAPPR
ncbi:MAG: protein kinase [Myxococcales bacterium]|nr:protein kinase [Myxococcales bacterium]